MNASNMESKALNYTLSKIILLVKLKVFLMEEIHVTAKRIGNSWGVIIPKKTADNLGLTENTELHLEIRQTPKLKELFGTFKPKKSTQQIKNELREGWGE